MDADAAASRAFAVRRGGAAAADAATRRGGAEGRADAAEEIVYSKGGAASTLAHRGLRFEIDEKIAENVALLKTLAR